MIDARIPLMYQGIDIGDIMEDAERMKTLRLQREQLQQQGEDRRRLADLLPRAQSGDTAALNQIAGIDRGLFKDLSSEQRERAKQRIGEIAAAARWADNPQKWDQAIDILTRQGIDVSQYRGRFDLREQAILQMGAMGQYLESAPKPEYRSIEAGGSLIDVSGGNPRVVIAPNDGSRPTGAPVQSGGVQEGATATNPQTGERIIYRNGQWQPMGDAGSNASGGFPY